MLKEQKIFIIGLPRTATTSVCLAMLELGFKTAHTAYTHKAMAQAQVIADTPIFCDYQQLDQQYENAKFIYLTRDLSLWLPSIKQLLQRMATNLLRTDGGFNPTIKRCYQNVFSPFTEENISQDSFLTQCYQKHHQEILSYFKHRPQDLLIIDVSEKNSYCALVEFLKQNTLTGTVENRVTNKRTSFEHINIGGKVTAWNKIKHQCKVESTNKGRVDNLVKPRD
jgi:hypothetical protein